MTPDQLYSILRYDPETGTFTWKVRTANGRARPGVVAGHALRSGHITIRYNGATHLAHRLAWLYVHREWPRGWLDHIDGNPANNRIDNLRLATPSQNQANKRRGTNNTSGYKGVTFDRSRGKWIAAIMIGGRTKHLGRFSDPARAHAAYVEAATRAFGPFARAA